MAGSKSNYLENAILDGIIGGGTWSKPATVYIALSTAAYTDAATGAAMTEVTNAGAYARVAVTNNATNFPAAVNGAKSNGAVFTFPTATASWGTILSWYIVDSGTYGAGNVLMGADVTTSKTVGTGDTASFPVGSMTFSED